jgi:hypothetical protein
MRTLLVVVAALFAIGCSKGVGQSCSGDGDCGDGLVCVAVDNAMKCEPKGFAPPPPPGDGG